MRKLIFLLFIFFFSCNASKKIIHSEKIESTNTSEISSIVSTTAKINHVSNEHYQKEIKNAYQPFTFDSSAKIDSGIKYVTEGKKKIIFLPVSTVTQWGNIAQADSNEVVTNEKSKDQKISKLVKSISNKNVTHKHNWLTFFLSLLFVLFCLIVSVPKLRGLFLKYISFLNPLKYFL